MPTFSYTARDRAGTQTNGVIAAKDPTEVREVLRNKELFVTTLREQAGPTAPATSFSFLKPKKVKLSELVVMSRQMATLVKSGISIVECLHAVGVQTENPILKQAINEIRLDVLTGS